MESARAMASDALFQGKAWEKFHEMVSAQGGDVSYIDHPEKMAKAKLIQTITAPRPGYLVQINAQVIGEASVILGAGRAKKSDAIDHSVGIIVLHKVGDLAQEGEPLFIIHANDPEKLRVASEMCLESIEWSNTVIQPLPLFYGAISSEE
jgi:pyrimidine-nucleoside phosphorylase